MNSGQSGVTNVDMTADCKVALGDCPAAQGMGTPFDVSTIDRGLELRPQRNSF